MMKKVNFIIEDDPKMSEEEFWIMSSFLKDMSATLVANLGDDIIDYIEKDHDMSVTLFVAGCDYGMKNMGLSQCDIINKTQEFRSMAREQVKEFSDPSIEAFNKFSEIYTQILIQGIYFAQKNARIEN